MLNPRLETFYEKIICEDFVVLYNYTNIASLPKFSQAILSSTSNNLGSSEISVVQSFCAWRLNTSQKSMVTRARKSIAFFNTRKEMILGLKTTLRKKALFSILDKALIFVLPKSISESYNSSLRHDKSSYLQEKNESRVVHSVHYMTKDKPKKVSLTLPSLTKSEKVFRKDLNNLYTIKFLNKLSENWDKQNNEDFLDTFCLDEDFSSRSEPKSNDYYLNLKNSKEKYAFLLKKSKIKSNNNYKGYKSETRQNKSFFTISNKSESFFPEIVSLSSFFDHLSGFSLTFSLKKFKFFQSKSEIYQNLSLTREDLIKKQFFSAFGCPK